MVGTRIRKQSFIHQHPLSIASTRKRPGRVNPSAASARRKSRRASAPSSMVCCSTICDAPASESGPGRSPGARGDSHQRPQDAGRVRALQHRSQRDLQDAARKLEGYLAAQNGVSSGQIGHEQEKEAVAKSRVIN